MRRNTVDSVAAAVVRRLRAGGRRASPAAALVASLTVPRSRRPGPVAAIASATSPQLAASRRGRPPAAAQPIDILAGKLASAVTKRLATGPAAPGIPLSASRLTQGIVRSVARQLGKSPGVEPVALGTIDPAGAAKALTGAMERRRAAPVDPAAIVASTILRRLSTVRLVGTPAEARAFQGRVASIVTASLRPAPAETDAPSAEQSAAPPMAPEAPGSAESTAAKSGSSDTTSAARK